MGALEPVMFEEFKLGTDVRVLGEVGESLMEVTS